MKYSFILILVSFLLNSCSEPNDRTDEFKDLSANDKQRILKKHNAEKILDLENVYFGSSKNKIQDCTLCHDKPIKSEPNTKLNHWNIKLKHSDSMDCSSCHNPTKPHQLQMGKKKVDIKHSYNLCSSCHFEQYEDWKGGAHGKRLTGWKEPRIISNCVSCHDPHSPEFKDHPTVAHPDIIPKRLNHLKVKK
jgi:hypothetical protein